MANPVSSRSSVLLRPAMDSSAAHPLPPSQPVHKPIPSTAGLHGNRRSRSQRLYIRFQSRRIVGHSNWRFGSPVLVHGHEHREFLVPVTTDIPLDAAAVRLLRAWDGFLPPPRRSAHIAITPRLPGFPRSTNIRQFLIENTGAPQHSSWLDRCSLLP